MNQQKILKKIAEAESAIYRLYDEFKTNWYKADYRVPEDVTLHVFFPLAEIETLAKEGPVPSKVNKAQLLDTIAVAIKVCGRLSISTSEQEYRVADTEAYLLLFVLDDLREVVNEQKAKDWTLPRDNVDWDEAPSGTMSEGT